MRKVLTKLVGSRTRWIPALEGEGLADGHSSVGIACRWCHVLAAWTGFNHHLDAVCPCGPTRTSAFGPFHNGGRSWTLPNVCPSQNWSPSSGQAQDGTGSLQWLAGTTRGDMFSDVSVLQRLFSELTVKDLLEIYAVLQYVKATICAPFTR